MLKSDLEKALLLYENGDINKSLIQFSNLCDNKNAQACYDEALIYKKSENFDAKNIEKLYTKSCLLGYSTACYCLAKEFYGSNLKKSKELYLRACKLNDYESCFIYANLQSKQKNDIALSYLKFSCDNKYAKACLKIGNLYYNKIVTIKPEKKDFLFNLEKMYKNIIDTKFDEYFTEAFKYYQKACNLREERACFLQANMYKNGIGVKKDIKSSFELYRRSCNWGYEKACKMIHD